MHKDDVVQLKNLNLGLKSPIRLNAMKHNMLYIYKHNISAHTDTYKNNHIVFTPFYYRTNIEMHKLEPNTIKSLLYLYLVVYSSKLLHTSS